MTTRTLNCKANTDLVSTWHLKAGRQGMREEPPTECESDWGSRENSLASAVTDTEMVGISVFKHGIEDGKFR